MKRPYFPPALLVVRCASRIPLLGYSVNNYQETDPTEVGGGEP